MRGRSTRNERPPICYQPEKNADSQPVAGDRENRPVPMEGRPADCGQLRGLLGAAATAVGAFERLEVGRTAECVFGLFGAARLLQRLGIERPSLGYVLIDPLGGVVVGDRLVVLLQLAVSVASHAEGLFAAFDLQGGRRVRERLLCASPRRSQVRDRCVRAVAFLASISRARLKLASALSSSLSSRK